MGMIIKVKKSYFNYLLSLIKDDAHDPSQYTKLCSLLFETPYQVLNPMDANRVSDAETLIDKWLDYAKVKDERLRQEYTKDLGTQLPSLMGISIFEVLIALAIKVDDYILGDPTKPDLPANLFWNFIDNIVSYGTFGSKYEKADYVLHDDNWCDSTEETMKSALNRINTRTYHPDGTGGLFPLKHARINQRKEELWTCCMAYINENY